MKHINFIEVGMKNYGPYIDDMVLPLNQHNLSLITGPNGIGKTMILDAIPFSLYGTTSKGKKGDDLVNNKVGKNCHTWLTFEIDSVPYRVDRYHKHSKFGNTVMLKKGDQEISKGQRELVPLIESLVVPQRLFMNTLFFGQSVKTFFTDLTDADKKEIFRKILDLDKYTTYYEETTKRLKELEDKKTKITNDLSVKRTLFPSFQKQIDLILEEEKEFYRRKQMLIETYQNDISDCQELVKKLNPLLSISSVDLLAGVNQKILECKSDLELIKKTEENEYSSLANAKATKKNELVAKTNKIKEELRGEIDKRIQEITKSYDDILQNESAKLKDLEKVQQQEEIKRSNTQFQIHSLSKQEKELSTNIQTLSICPTCLQVLDDKGKTNLKSKRNEIVIQKESLENDNLTCVNKLNSLSEAIQNSRHIISEQSDLKQKSMNEQQTILAGKFREVDSKVELVLEEIELRTQQASAGIKQKYIEKKNLLTKAFSDLVSQKNKYEKEVEEQKKVKETLDVTLAKIVSLTKVIEEKKKEEFDKRRLVEIQEQIKVIESEVKLLNEQQKLVQKQDEILNFWKVGFSSSGIPSLLIDESIPFMNNRVSYYLDKISNGRYTVSFDTLQATKAGEFRDKISVNVLDNITKANSRVQLSGGQTRIVDIATILTLCDLQSNVQNVTFNLLLFDEIFDSLDDENIGFVSKVLKELAKEKSLFIISHRYIDQIEADNIISLR